MSDGTSTTAVNPELYARLGSIVRELNAALQAIGADDVLAEAASEFPSARERLLHIGTLTEKAANEVLNRVEESRPVQEALLNTAEALKTSWSSVPCEMLPPEAQELTRQTASFLDDVTRGCEMTCRNLSGMMMAQDFQDLTGQLILKVVAVLARTENDLLRLLIDAAPPGTVSLGRKEEMMAGPGAPGSVALAQNDVDNLLADLGF